MTGRHYRWHRRWTIDLLAASATHDSGFIARFITLPMTESQKQEHDADAAIGTCWTPDGRQWGIVTTRPMLEATFEALKAKNGPHNGQTMLARLAREAGEVWARQKAKEH